MDTPTPLSSLPRLTYYGTCFYLFAYLLIYFIISSGAL